MKTAIAPLLTIAGFIGWNVSAPSLSSATTIHVPGQHPTIQAALDVSAPGDTVLVAPGVYQDTVSRTTPINATFCAAIPAGVVLKSEAGAASTTIHLPATGAPRSWAIVIDGSLSVPRELNGFTVTVDSGATAGALIRLGHLVLKECRFEGILGNPNGNPYSEGGALHADGSVEAFDCQFLNCRADYGGGVFFEQAAFGLRKQTFERCEFTECEGAASYHFNEQPWAGVEIRYEDCVSCFEPGRWPFSSNARDIEIIR